MAQVRTLVNDNFSKSSWKLFELVCEVKQLVTGNQFQNRQFWLQIQCAFFFCYYYYFFVDAPPVQMSSLAGRNQSLRIFIAFWVSF